MKLIAIPHCEPLELNKFNLAAVVRSLAALSMGPQLCIPAPENWARTPQKAPVEIPTAHPCLTLWRHVIPPKVRFLLRLLHVYSSQGGIQL